MKQQIIGSFEDIGKNIVQEAVKVPTDVAGKALESLGTPQKGKGQQVKQVQKSRDNPKEKINTQTARAALEQFARPKKKEPTVQERLDKEDQEKEEKKKEKIAKEEKMAPLPKLTTKQRRGNLWAVPQPERSKNARQD